jgi:hypothetical protein
VWAIIQCARSRVRARSSTSLASRACHLKSSRRPRDSASLQQHSHNIRQRSFALRTARAAGHFYESSSFWVLAGRFLAMRDRPR